MKVLWVGSSKGGNYAEQITRAISELKPGEVAHVEVRHDHWCAFLVRDGACDCEPAVAFLSFSEKKGP